jgi:UDP-N-acetylenolpyruvoylglucosamine reductase
VLSLGAGNIHEQLSILAADLVIAEKLKEIVGEEGDVRLYEPLAKHTTLRVGGPAQFWVEPRNENAFAELIRYVGMRICRSSSSARIEFARARRRNSRRRIHPSGGEFDRVEVVDGEITAGVGAKLKQVAYAGKARALAARVDGRLPGEVGGAFAE